MLFPGRKEQFRMLRRFRSFGCSKAFGGYGRWPQLLAKHVHANVP